MRMAGTVIDPAVVASLAQSATGDEKLAAAQLANAALEDTASVNINLDNNSMQFKNDGNPAVVVRGGGMGPRWEHDFQGDPTGRSLYNQTVGSSVEADWPVSSGGFGATVVRDNALSNREQRAWNDWRMNR